MRKNYFFTFVAHNTNGKHRTSPNGGKQHPVGERGKRRAVLTIFGYPSRGTGGSMTHAGSITYYGENHNKKSTIIRGARCTCGICGLTSKDAPNKSPKNSEWRPRNRGHNGGGGWGGHGHGGHCQMRQTEDAAHSLVRAWSCSRPSIERKVAQDVAIRSLMGLQTTRFPGPAVVRRRRSLFLKTVETSSRPLLRCQRSLQKSQSCRALPVPIIGTPFQGTYNWIWTMGTRRLERPRRARWMGDNNPRLSPSGATCSKY